LIEPKRSLPGASPEPPMFARFSGFAKAKYFA
jgi:hypothetical protein